MAVPASAPSVITGGDLAPGSPGQGKMAMEGVQTRPGLLWITDACALSWDQSLG